MAFKMRQLSVLLFIAEMLCMDPCVLYRIVSIPIL